MSSTIREGRSRGNVNTRPLTEKPGLPPPSQGGVQNKSASCDNNQAIEKIKRMIYNALDKLEDLKDK
jgi:hypothetical protein